MTDDYVVVALERVAAEALCAGATVGLEDAPEAGLADAGWEAKNVIERALALEDEPDRELLVVKAGLTALDSLFSHYPEMIVLDEDGTGILSADDYRNLFALYSLIRYAKAEVDAESFRTRVRAAIEKGDDEFRAAEQKDEAHGIDDRHDHYVEAVVREFTTAPEGEA